MTTRRDFLMTGSALAGIAAIGLYGRGVVASADDPVFEFTLTDAEWRKLLTPAEYRVMRKNGTERRYSSNLLYEDRVGTYTCAGCELELYDSDKKYNSDTGWPSFWAARDNAVVTLPDRTLFQRRTEVVCRRCGSHLGHVFDDGPPPTGKRHCINGIAMDFVAA